MSHTGSQPIRSIEPAELHAIVRSGKPVEILDVRTPGEYQSAHVPGARSVPLGVLDPSSVMGSRALPGEPLYVICRSGGRSMQACQAFSGAGYGANVVNVSGGTLAWEQAGLPLDKGARSVLPLDRQVRIAIGLVVLAGALLGYLASPWFYWLCAACGAGLVFAGVFDFCPLAATLARMPWNQGPAVSPTRPA